MSKSEMRANYGARNRQIIKRDELVMALASCTVEPAIVRRGKQQFFVNPYYEKIFNGRKVDEYLNIYWLYIFSKRIYTGRGPDIGYSRHLVNFHVWGDVKKLLKKRHCSENFIYLVRRRKYEELKPLEDLIEITIREAMACYKHNKYYLAKDKHGNERHAIYAELDYFKRGSVLKEWSIHWANNVSAPRRKKYETYIDKIGNILIEYER